MPAKMTRSTRSRATAPTTSPCTRARRCTRSIDEFAADRRQTAMWQAESTMGSTIWTIGHSTRPLQAFLELLAHYRLEGIADGRRFPGSRRPPQYAEGALRAALAEHDIAYHWLPGLGGRRRPRPDSPNTAWRNASFRGYADHIDSAEFAHGMSTLLELSGRLRTSLLCAED